MDPFPLDGWTHCPGWMDPLPWMDGPTAETPSSAAKSVQRCYSCSYVAILLDICTLPYMVMHANKAPIFAIRAYDKISIQAHKIKFEQKNMRKITKPKK